MVVINISNANEIAGEAVTLLLQKGAVGRKMRRFIERCGDCPDDGLAGIDIVTSY